MCLKQIKPSMFVPLINIYLHYRDRNLFEYSTYFTNDKRGQHGRLDYVNYGAFTMLAPRYKPNSFLVPKTLISELKDVL